FHVTGVQTCALPICADANKEEPSSMPRTSKNIALSPSLSSDLFSFLQLHVVTVTPKTANKKKRLLRGFNVLEFIVMVICFFIPVFRIRLIICVRVSKTNGR